MVMVQKLLQAVAWQHCIYGPALLKQHHDATREPGLHPADAEGTEGMECSDDPGSLQKDICCGGVSFSSNQTFSPDRNISAQSAVRVEIKAFASLVCMLVS